MEAQRGSLCNSRFGIPSRLNNLTSFDLYASYRGVVTSSLGNKSAPHHKKSLRLEAFFMARPAGFELTTF